MSLSQDIWRININVREYLVAHYTPYDGDEAFLARAESTLFKYCAVILEELLPDLGFDVGNLAEISQVLRVVIACHVRPRDGELPDTCRTLPRYSGQSPSFIRYGKPEAHVTCRCVRGRSF